MNKKNERNKQQQLICVLNCKRVNMCLYVCVYLRFWLLKQKQQLDHLFLCQDI